MGATARIPIQITGSGFDPTASNNLVIFTSGTGETASVRPTSIVLVDSTRDLRRVTVVVPSGLPVGPAALAVRNEITGVISAGLSVEIIELNLPAVVSAPRGASNLAVRVTGTPNTQFDPRARALFGSGVTLHSTNVESETSLVALISISDTAAVGARDVTVLASTQRGLVLFTITSADVPVNQAPAAVPGGPYAGSVGAPVAFSSAGSSDPDGDALTYHWDFGDGNTSTDANPTHIYSAPAEYSIRLTVTDSRGASHSAGTEARIEARPPPNRQPQANPGGPYAGVAGSAVAFDGTGSSDPDGDPLTYVWEFGDGSQAIGASLSHTYATVGDFVVSLTVTDPSGATHSATTTATIGPPPNRPPTAHAGGPYAGTVNTAMLFNGTQSIDPDGDSMTYAWSFGDGRSATGPAPSHTYAQSGSYVVTLLVSDGRGGTATAATSAIVQVPAGAGNTRPRADAGGPYAGRVGQAVTFDGSASSDPDGDPLSFTWSFGDGTTGSGESPSHTYAEPGTFEVVLLVSDGRGGHNSATAQIAVSDSDTPPPGNRPPAAHAGGPYAATAGVPIVLSGAASTDPDGDALTYVWAFGDGASGSGVSPAHVYAHPGEFQVTLLVSDGHGTPASAVALVTVTAEPNNAAPTAVVGGPYFGTAGQPVALSGEGSFDPDNDALTFAWNMGDGAQSGTAAPTHTYAREGTYVLALRVSDGRGGVSTAATLVYISAPPSANTPPVADAGGPYGATAGDPVAFSGSGSSDQDGDPLTFVWSFGDGATGVGSAPQHTYGAEGVYTLTLVVDDGRGGVSTAVTAVRVVGPPVPGNQPPAAAAGGPYVGIAGNPLSFDATASSDPDGDALTFSWSFGDGATGSGASPVHRYARPGSYVATVLVDDGRGGFHTATADVSISAPPTANRLPSANAGGPYAAEPGVEITFDGGASFDPDGDELTFEWSFGDGSQGAGPTPVHAYGAAGVYPVTLVVRDGRGGSATASATAIVGAVADRAPPVVALTGPLRVLPGSEVVLTAHVEDDVAVAKVIFEVNGGDVTEHTSPPYRRTVQIPQVAAPGTTIRIRAVARDPSDNTGEAEVVLTISVQPDTTAPDVTLTLPPSGAPGTTVSLIAEATDDVGVRAVTFFVAGSPVGTDTDAPYEALYTIPADADAETTFLVSGRAVDFAGNAGEASGSIRVIASADVSPPVATLSAPPQALPGGRILLTATAADNVGVAAVSFFVDGVRIATVSRPPYEAAHTLGPAVLPGAVVHSRVVARDFSGLEGTATGQTSIVAPPTAGRGVLTGEVYDDQNGLPLSGATVTLSGSDALGAAYSATASTDARGRYQVRANAGSGRLRIERAGWTIVDRVVTIVAGQAMEIMDARLTRLPTTTQTVTPVLGGKVSSRESELQVPAGAVTGSSALRITPISQQGLQGLLPPGWSPVGGADVWPHGVTLLGGASLTVSNRFGLPTGTRLVLAFWDETAMGWRGAGAGAVSADGQRLEATVERAAQYAWLLPDVVPIAPPEPAAGSLVQGVESSALPGAVQTAIDPQPKVVFYSPGVSSNVRGTLTTEAPLSSGRILWSRITEAYRFYSGAEIHLEPYVQDIVLYQVSGDPASTRAAFPVTPSLTFDALTLEQGVISVELFVPPADPTRPVVVGHEGGVVAGPNGIQLSLPPGALPDAFAFDIQRLTPGELGIALPPGLELVEAARLNFAGTLQHPATLSVPAPPQADPSRTLVVQLAEIRGQTRFVLVAAAASDGNRLVSAPLAGAEDALPGIVTAGRYLFVQATSPVGFTAGLVRGIDAGPFAGALVTTAELPIVSQSMAAGRYAAAVNAGTVVVTATDLARSDTGAAQATVAAVQLVPLDLQLAAQPPRVISFTPQANAVNVPLSNPIVVRFSEAIDPATVGGATGHVRLEAGGARVDGAITLSGDGTVLTFRPVSLLAANTQHTFTISQAVTDLSGHGLLEPFTLRFESLDTEPPPAPPAGSISAGIPDESGHTTVNATQGTASPHDTVSLLNVTKGTSTPVLVDPNGGFSVRVPVGLEDTLRLRLVDRAGNETLVDVGPFRSADGRVVVGPAGGRLEAANGLVLDVPPGAFPQGSIVRFTAVDEGAVGVPPHPEFPFVAAFEIDSSATPQIYLNVSAPVPPGTDPSTQGIVAKLVTVVGQPALSIVDTAKIVDGQLRTSSPPCQGIVDKFGRYAMYLNEDAQMKFGVALLSMSVPRLRTFTTDPIYLHVYTPFVPTLPVPISPPLQFDFPYFPANHFIKRIEAGDLAGGLLGAASNPQFCMLAPADRPVQVVMLNANTGAPLGNIPATAPPAGQVFVVDTSFVDPNDAQAPTVVLTSWGPESPHLQDPGQLPFLLFSEPVTVDAGGIYLEPDDSPGSHIAGAVTLRENNRLLVFAPARPLQIGRRYLVRMGGVKDLAGNVFQDPATGTHVFTVMGPQLLTPTPFQRFDRQKIMADLGATTSPPSTIAFNDIDFVTRSPEESADGRWHTSLFATGRGYQQSFQLLTVDASDPADPVALSAIPPGVRYFQRLRVFDDISFDTRDQGLAAWQHRELHYVQENPSIRICAPPGDPAIFRWQQANSAPGQTLAMKTGCGDLVVSTSYNSQYSIAHFYDATDPASPSPVGQRLLSDNGPPFGFPRRNEAPASFGFARGLDVIEGLSITHDDEVNSPTAGAYVAVQGTGLALVDLGRNIPDLSRALRFPNGPVHERLGYWTFPYYVDVRVVGDKVVALASDRTGGTGLNHIEAFGLGLNPLGLQPLPLVAGEMAVWPGVPFDSNGDGTPEHHNLVLISGNTGKVATVEIHANGSISLLGLFSTPASVRQLRHIDIDREAFRAYIAGNWTENGNDVSGFLVLDLRQPFGNPQDEDMDGWDDRFIGRVPIVGAGQVMTAGEVRGFKIDSRRRLIYAAIDSQPYGDQQVSIAILRIGHSAEVALTSGALDSPVEPLKTFPSPDGNHTILFVTPDPQNSRLVFADFDVKVSEDVTLTYTITEQPLSGNPADALLDLSGGAATGTFDPSSPRIQMVLNPQGELPPGSFVYVDFRDNNGVLVKRALLVLTPVRVLVAPVKLQTTIDRINQHVCEAPDFLRFLISHDAEVTIRIDGTIIPRVVDGQVVGLFENVRLAQGINQVPVTRDLVTLPGDHQVEITARFDDQQGISAIGLGTITHEIVINESLPIGHTFVKGVDVFDGHVTLQREDLTIPGLGPQLQFTRTYSSLGNRSTGPMGAGWTHSYEGRLIKDGCGVITIVGGEGTGTRFFQNSNGTWRPGAGYHGRLTYTGSANAYDFYTKHGIRYHYRPDPGISQFSVYKLRFVEDPHGNRTTLTYASERPHTLTEVRDAGGRTLTFAYEQIPPAPPAAIDDDGDNHRITRIEGPLGLLVTFGYDEFGNLTSAARADRSESYVYKTDDVRDRHNLIGIHGPSNGAAGGNVVAIEYYQDSDTFPGENSDFVWGREILLIPLKYELVKRMIDAPGTPVEAPTSFAFDYSSFQTQLVTRVTDPRSTVTTYLMGARGHTKEERISTPSGDIVTRMKWAFEETPPIDDVYITERIDPLGRVTKYEYDSLGNLTRETIVASSAGLAPVTDASGATLNEVVTVYDFETTFSKMTRKVDSEGNVTANVVDPTNGNLLSTTIDVGDGTSLVTTYTYNADGTLLTAADARSVTTTYSSYDGFGNPTMVVDGAGNTTTLVYDARSRLLSSSDTFGRQTTYAYDDLDRAREVLKSAGAQPALAGLTSADQRVVNEYFPNGRKRSATDGLGQTTTYEYDALDRLVLETDTIADADGATSTLTMTYGYDGNGNRTSEIDRRGIERRHVYDALNRLTNVEVHTDTGIAQVAAYTYDAVGNKLTETDLHGHVTSFTYDGLYRQVRTDLPEGGLFTSTKLDSNGNLLAITDANENTTVMTYDGASRLRSITDALGNVTTYDYDLSSNRIREATSAGLVTTYTGFDGLNRPAAMVQQFPDAGGQGSVQYTTTYSYDDAQHTRDVVNPRQFRMRERLNGLDQVIERTVDVGGLELVTTFAYDGNGNQFAVQDPESASPTLLTAYDGFDRPIRKTYALGHEERVYYDGNGNIVREVDRRGIERQFAYDALNRRIRDILVESITNGSAPLVLSRTEFDDAANAVTLVDAKDNKTRQEFDGLHRLVRSVNAIGQVARVEWDGVNKRAEVDNRGLRREYDYDPLNRLVAVREFDAAGEIATRTSTQFFDAQRERIDIDRGGVETLTRLDGLQRIRQIVRRHPSLRAVYGAEEIVFETIDYDENGNRVSVTDANGHRRTYAYDAADRMERIVEGAGTAVAATTTYTYDGVGNLLTVKSGRDHGGPFDVRYTYDDRHRRESEEDAIGNVRVFGYDENDNLIAVTEPLGGVTRYEYDELNKLITVNDTRGGAGGLTRYVYDANRNRIAQQDANGSLTTYRYDALNRATDTFHHREPGSLSTSRTAPVGGNEATALHIRSEYDGNGNETHLFDAMGQVVVKTYDHLDRLTSKTYSNHQPGVDGAGVFPRLLSVTYTRDLNGNVVRTEERKEMAPSATPVTQVSTGAFDALDRLASETNADGKTVQYTYDRQGNRTRVTDADGVPTLYTYDARHRVATVTTELGTGTGTTSHTYLPDSLVASVASPNGTTALYGYDAAGRLQSIVNHDGNPANPLSRYDYAYDANGNRTSQVERHRNLTGNAPETTTYGYDALNRLTRVTYPTGAVMEYSLAPNGNRLREVGTDPATNAAVDRAYTYNRLNQLTTIRDLADPSASRTYAYDANGNARERLTGMLDADGQISAPLASQRYLFDVRDQLAAADQLTGGGRVSFDYDHAGRRIRMLTPAFDLRFLYDGQSALQHYDGATGLTTQRFNYGLRLVSSVSVTAAGRRSVFFTFDGLGSTSTLTDEGGVLRAAYRHDPWGRLFQSHDTTDNRRRFTGHYFDPETGLHYFGARYYDDSVGRFLSRDPFGGNIMEPPSLHAYNYAHGNPNLYTDPDGRAANLVFGAVGAVVGGLGGCAIGIITEVGCGKGAAVGAATLGLAGLTFGWSMAATGAFGVGVGGGSSMWVSMTATLAVGSYTFGAGAELAKGGSLADAHVMGSVGAFLNTAPMILGPIGEAFAGYGSGMLARQAIFNVGENLVTQKIMASTGFQDSLNGSQAMMAAAFPFGAAAAGRILSPMARGLGGIANQATAAGQLLMRQRDFSKIATELPDGSVVARQMLPGGRLGLLTVGDAWKIAGHCLDSGRGCGFVGGLSGPSFKNLVSNVSGTLSGFRSQARGSLQVKWDGTTKQVVPVKYSGDIDMVVLGREFATDARSAAALNSRLSSPMFDTTPNHGLLGEFLPPSLTPNWAKELWWSQRGYARGTPINAMEYWQHGVRTKGAESGVAYLIKPGTSSVVARAPERHVFSLRNWEFDDGIMSRLAGLRNSPDAMRFGLDSDPLSQFTYRLFIGPTVGAPSLANK